MNATSIRIVLGVQAAAFLAASLVHLGGLAILGEPYMPQAGIPEGVIGLVLLAGLAASFARDLAWPAALATVFFATLGTLVGIVALNTGRGTPTVADEAFHAVILVSLVATIALLLSAGRTALWAGAAGRDLERRR